MSRRHISNIVQTTTEFHYATTLMDKTDGWNEGENKQEGSQVEMESCQQLLLATVHA